MLVDVVNLLFHDETSAKRLPAVPQDAGSMGYQGLTDFTWKELMDLDACTKCGRCHVACPARAAGMPLSPRDLILELREHAERSLGGRSWLHESAIREVDHTVTGKVIKVETLWACTTCMACVEACPVGIEHVPLIVQMRRKLVEDGTMDGNLQSVLEKLARYGNSFGQSERLRGRWTQGLPFKVKDIRKEPAELLWFVGDYASYDPSLQELTRATARVFQKAGLDFGILYDGERNSGNDVRRVGEEGLFETLVSKNLSVLKNCEFKEIVTTDPHSYNTLKNEYPEFLASQNGAWQVSHYTEVLARLLETGRLVPSRRLNYRATYHDPCYLARYNAVTEAPRRILKALGVDFIEMPRAGENTFCCGAGGGRFWMSDTRAPGMPTSSEQRIQEALALGNIDLFVVGCPKDVTMYRDGVKTSGNEGRITVKDLIELVEEAL
jgi:Fe-S oxidoreductase